jgi:hypothetical protein
MCSRARRRIVSMSERNGVDFDGVDFDWVDFDGVDFDWVAMKYPLRGVGGFRPV